MTDYASPDKPARLDPKIIARVERLRQQYQRHDRKSEMMRRVREGRWDEVAPEIFSEEWPGPTVANLIDVQIRQFTASASAIPSINCSSVSLVSEKARERADKRTKIANHYASTSNLKHQMPMGVDAYAAYGLLVFSVKPDADLMLPRIHIEDSQQVWPIWDEDMRTVAVARSFWLDSSTLRARYNIADGQMSGSNGAPSVSHYEVIKYEDDKACLTYVPMLQNLILEYSDNPLGKCSWVCVPRYSGGPVFDGRFRGAYDDLVWPQLARHNFQMLAMSSADQAVNAPLIVGTDVGDIPFGPMAVVRTNNPAGVQRARVDVPREAFQSLQWLREDMIEGGMTTEANLGSAGTGWTTGQGADRLGQGYDGQVALAQIQFGFGLQQAIALCFEWDEKLWGDEPKKIRGMEQGGSPYQLTYTPSKDIDGDYTVDIRYGFLSGMDDNRALVFILQAQAAGLVSKDFGRRHLPEGVDAAEEERKIRLEQMQDALGMAMQSLPQAIPQMVTQGADPSQLVAQYAGVIADLEKGETIQQSVLKRFAPPEPPAAASSPDAGQPSPAPGDSAAAGNPAAGGLLGGQPEARTPLNMLMAGLTSRGSPNLAAAVSRQTPAA